MVFVGVWKIKSWGWHRNSWRLETRYSLFKRFLKASWKQRYVDIASEAGYGLRTFWLAHWWFLGLNTQLSWTILNTKASLGFREVHVNLGSPFVLELWLPFLVLTLSFLQLHLPSKPQCSSIFLYVLSTEPQRFFWDDLYGPALYIPGPLLVKKVSLSRMDSIYQTSRISGHWHSLQARSSLK